MRIVLDTNILVRAANPFRGPAKELLDFCQSEPHVLCLSDFLLTELNRVLKYEHLRPKHQLTDAGIDRYVADIRKAGHVIDVEPAFVIAVTMDPDDDAIVATAVVAGADVLCTLDRHLHAPPVIAYCEARGIDVMSDADLLQRMREAQG